MGFKKLRGVKLPASQQGYVHFACLTYWDQPKHIQEKITQLCNQCGGEYAAALWELLCTGESAVSIALRHHMSEATLYRARKRFYEGWFEGRGAGASTGQGQKK